MLDVSVLLRPLGRAPQPSTGCRTWWVSLCNGHHYTVCRCGLRFSGRHSPNPPNGGAPLPQSGTLKRSGLPLVGPIALSVEHHCALPPDERRLLHDETRTRGQIHDCPRTQSQTSSGTCSAPPRPQGCIGRGGGTHPPLQGAQLMPSHCPPDAKCPPQWHL